MQQPFSLQGRVALITGGGTGIGFDIAKCFLASGATVVITGRREDVLKEAVANLGSGAHYAVNDVADLSLTSALVSELISKHGGIDILVNNAGTILRDPAAEHSDEYWDEVLEVNLSSQFILSREIGRSMLAHGSGKIIFTASLLSFQGGINVPGYAASKGGIARLTMALANEWASKGINVNAIAPGYISTDNTTALREDKERSASILGRIPVGRWGEPNDFKGPVVFLASDAAKYVHGTILTVDGGWMGR
mgnify:CR=1 FL=1